VIHLVFGELSCTNVFESCQDFNVQEKFNSIVHMSQGRTH
jgi:hypothetical protein